MAYGPFVAKDWQNSPSTASPLSAAAIEDLEARVAAEASSQGRSVFNVLTDHGAAGDGTTDDTAAINEAITAANALGGGDVFLPPCEGGYGVTADANPIILLANVRIMGSGYAGRIERIGTYEKSVGRRIFAALDSTNGIANSEIRDLYVDGNTSSVTLTSTQLNGATVGGETTINVDDTTNFPTSGEMMIASTACAYTGKSASTFTGCTSIPAAADNTVVYESVGNLSSQLIRYYPLDEGEHHTNIRVEGCEFVDWPGAVLHLDDAEWFSIQGNIVRNAARGGLIFFHDNHYGIVNNNVVHSADDCIAIQANSNVASVAKGTGPAYVTINGNTCESFGITNQFTNNNLNIQGLVDSVISGNTCIGAGESGGGNKASCRISLSDGTTADARYECKRLNVTGNYFYSPDDHGIYIPPESVEAEPLEDIHFGDNVIVDAGQGGISVQGYVNRLTITGNSVEGSNARNSGTFDGMRIVDAHNFLIANNYVTDRRAQQRYGINVQTASTLGTVKNNVAPDTHTTTRGFNNDTTSVLFSGNEPGAFGSIASATAVTLRDGYEYHHITGTTTITSITAQGIGQKVTLIFAGVLTLTDGSNLSLAGNFVTTAGDTITLVCDGTNWIELARSAN